MTRALSLVSLVPLITDIFRILPLSNLGFACLPSSHKRNSSRCHYESRYTCWNAFILFSPKFNYFSFHPIFSSSFALPSTTLSLHSLSSSYSTSAQLLLTMAAQSLPIYPVSYLCTTPHRQSPPALFGQGHLVHAFQSPNPTSTLPNVLLPYPCPCPDKPASATAFL